MIHLPDDPYPDAFARKFRIDWFTLEDYARGHICRCPTGCPRI